MPRTDSLARTSTDLDRQQACCCVNGVRSPRDGHGAVGRKGYAVKAGHDRIGIGNAAMQPSRACAAEQHRTTPKAQSCLQEHLADIGR
jgi:hypothetical protein